MICDHAIVDIKKKVTYRKHRAIAITRLRTDILESNLAGTLHSTLENLVEQYNNALLT